MLVYLIKSGACMAILLLFYKLILERESMHTFKRIFLLSAIVVSFIIPAIVFVEYVEPAALSNPEIPVKTELSEYAAETAPIARPTDIDVINWSMLFWTIYCMGLIGFGFRFFRHLFQILHRIKTNPKLRENFNIKVLLKEKLPPHTFFSYIFLNKNKFESNSIPQAVLTHEETHAKEYHSLDVLFIEFLQVLLWFNPLIYLFKRSIKLNHEFLADSAVIKKETNTSDYQNTLLSYLTKESLEKYQSTGIANAINYSSIKKRFTVMKKRTSKKSVVLRSFLLLPLIALLLFGFSESKIVEIPKVKNAVTEVAILIENIEVHIDNEGRLFLQNKEPITLEGLKNHLLSLNQNLSKEERKNHVKVVVNVQADTPKEIIKEVDRILMDYGVAQLNIHGQEPAYVGKLIETVTEQSQLEKYNGLAKKYNAIPIEKRIIPLQDLRVLETIYRKMTDEQKQNAQPFPECLPQNKNQKTVNPIEIAINNNGQLLVQDALVPLEDLKSFLSKINDHLSFEQRKNLIRSIINVDTKTPKDEIQTVNKILTDYGSATINIIGPKDSTQSRQQQSATREEMAAYNELAKKYNEMDRNQMWIKNSEVKRLKALYSKMSDKQKADAEPFPDFPPPPPVPDAPEIDNIKDVPPPKPPKNVSDVEYASNQIENIIEEQDPYDVGPGANLSKQPNQPIAPTYVKEIQPNGAAIPPAPPEPESPTDHIISMAKKGATFMYEGKEISSDKAIEILKNNNKINIESKSDNGKPTVRLSTKPITIK